MIYFVLAAVSFLVSFLTLFSGFGLGTLLMPAFAIFFPLPLAIAMTAVVHFANNLFKLFLLGKFANKEIVLKFGLPSIVAASIGAWCLGRMASWKPLAHYDAWFKTAEISYLGLIMALLMIVFALFEAVPYFKKLAFDKKYLGWGGLLSGFFGGLSGHQGALRSAFLIRCNLSKEAFIGTGVVIACLVDTMRLFVYSSRFQVTSENLPPVGISILAAFLGAWVGNRFLKKTTVEGIQKFVAVMLFIIAILLGSGII
jgi:uncharacterized protein